MFVGQEHIRRELELLIKDIKTNNNKYNILLVAPSGYGKTTLAYSILILLDFNTGSITLPPDFKFDYSKPNHFIDEVHLLDTPEILYPIMDSNKYNIILATNELGELKEPLINRCIVFSFSPYTKEELTNIASNRLITPISKDVLEALVDMSAGNPRNLVVLCRRLNYILPTLGNTINLNTFRDICDNILDLSPDGLNHLMITYLNYLYHVGGHCGIKQLCYGIHLTETTVLRDIEPALLYLGYVRITSRGRELTEKGVLLNAS